MISDFAIIFRRKKKFVIATVLLVLALNVFWRPITVITQLLIFGMPTGSDARESSQLCRALHEKFSSTQGLDSGANVPTISCHPGSHGLVELPINIEIYSLTELAKQDQIIDYVRDYRNTNSTKRVVIKFYLKENLTYPAPGVMVKGPEEILRTMTIR